MCADAHAHDNRPSLFHCRFIRWHTLTIEQKLWLRHFWGERTNGPGPARHYHRHPTHPRKFVSCVSSPQARITPEQCESRATIGPTSIFVRLIIRFVYNFGFFFLIFLNFGFVCITCTYFCYYRKRIGIACHNFILEFTRLSDNGAS